MTKSWQKWQLFNEGEHEDGVPDTGGNSTLVADIAVDDRLNTGLAPILGAYTVVDDRLQASAAVASSSGDGLSAPPPQDNGSAVTAVNAVAYGWNLVDSLLDGMRWNGAISYTDPNASGDYQAYFNDQNNNGLSVQNDGFGQISAQQLAAVHFALNTALDPLGAEGFAVEGFAGLNISYGGSGAGTGTLRIGNSSDPGTSYAWTPGNFTAAGDIWIGPSARTPTAGNYEWYTHLHEIGHALGLKHPHEAGGIGGVMDANYNYQEWTLMSYRSYQGAPDGPVTNETWGYGQTFMRLDILALQHLYGANYSVNSGSTVYSWSQTTGQTFVNGNIAISPGGNRIFETIWDGGGVDTYDLSNYTIGVSIDLRAGNSSDFSVGSNAQQAFLGGGTRYAAGHVYNAFMFGGNTASLIENANGGSNGDFFYGNEVNNLFDGNGGTDYAYVYATNTGTTVTETNNYVATVAGQGTDTFVDMEGLMFTNGTVLDDYRGGNLTSGTLRLGGDRAGDLQFYGDRDWFGVQLIKGQTYVFTQRAAASGLGTDGDPYLYLYNSGSTQIATNDDAGYGLDSRIIYTANNSGTFYLGASELSDNDTGTYRVGGQQLIYGSADFDASGYSDVLWRDYNNGFTGYYKNTGSGYSWVDFGAVDTGFVVVGTGDFNADGRSDVLWRSSQTNEVGYYALTPGGNSFSWTSLGTIGGNYSIVGAADFSGDGRSDILWRNLTTGDSGYYEMTGNTSYAWRGFGPVSSDYNVVGLADFNGDGRKDVLWRNDVNGNTGYYQIGAGGTFSWRDIGNISVAHKVVGAGDFNGDGIGDILWYNPTNGDAGYFQMNGGVGFTWRGYGFVDTNFAVVGVGDYTGNGTTDVMWRNYATDEIGYYANNSSGGFNWVTYANVGQNWDLL